MSKKIFFALTAVVCCMSMNAQILKIYNGETLVATYTADQADKVVFEEAVAPTHEYVDLGLPSGIKWATCNIGATSPEEYGDYFAWGETTPTTDDSWSSYKYCNGSINTLTKYCTSSSYGTVDNKTILEPEDDAAHVNWGGDWRMPTKEEQDELRNNCTWTWTTMNGVNGYRVTGTNGNSIFFPARDVTWLHPDVGFLGIYWSSSLSEYYSLGASTLRFDPNNYIHDGSDRNYGQSVRAVTP